MLNRRQFIEFGTKGIAAYALADTFTNFEVLGQQAVVPRNTAKTCIFIQMIGGPTHLETWDAKPGSWTPPDLDIRNYTGGVTMSNKLFPLLSQHANSLVLLRSVEAWEASHDRAQYYVQTAYAKNPAFQRERPSLGAVVAYELGRNKRPSEVLPSFIGINASPIGPGFLSAEFAPFNVGSGGNGIGTLIHPQGRDRFLRRYSMLQDLDQSLLAASGDVFGGDDVDRLQRLSAGLRKSGGGDDYGVFRTLSKRERRRGRDERGDDGSFQGFLPGVRPRRPNSRCERKCDKRSAPVSHRAPRHFPPSVEAGLRACGIGAYRLPGSSRSQWQSLESDAERQTRAAG